MPAALGLSLGLFLVLSPAFGHQYLVWPAAALFFVSLVGATVYNVLAGALIIIVYHRWNGGWPWDLALASSMTSGELALAGVVWVELTAVVLIGVIGQLRMAPLPLTGRGSRPGCAPAGEVRHQRRVHQGQRGGDRHVHVQVLVGAEPAAEQHLRLGSREFPVGQQPRPVGGSVDRVVRLVGPFGEPGELLDDHRGVVGVAAFRVEMPEFQDPGPRHVLVGVVHHRAALEVTDRQHLLIEIEGAPTQLTAGVIEVAVHRAGVDDRQRPARGGQADRSVVEDVGAEPDLDPRVVGHPLQPDAVAVDRQSLVGVGEVPVVVGVPERAAGRSPKRAALSGSVCHCLAV